MNEPRSPSVGGRRDLIDALASAIMSPRLAHPTRVAIDGRSAAGKTTLADELAEAISALGRDVIRSEIDDFHFPGHADRSRRGVWTAQSRYDEAYDYAAFRTLMLEPLGPGGNRRCRPALFDSFHDRPLPERWRDLADDAIAIVDGVFLQRPELAGHWDYVIWLAIDAETSLERARQRDIAWVGSEEAVVERYRRHTIPAEELYQRIVDPAAHADAVIDNRDVGTPVIVRLALL